MPPKPKFTREQIIAVGLDFMIQALTLSSASGSAL